MSGGIQRCCPHVMVLGNGDLLSELTCPWPAGVASRLVFGPRSGNRWCRAASCQTAVCCIKRQLGKASIATEGTRLCPPAPAWAPDAKEKPLRPGLEPGTSRLTVSRASQLSHRRRCTRSAFLRSMLRSRRAVPWLPAAAGAPPVSLLTDDTTVMHLSVPSRGGGGGVASTGGRKTIAGRLRGSTNCIALIAQERHCRRRALIARPPCTRGGWEAAASLAQVACRALPPPLRHSSSGADAW